MKMFFVKEENLELNVKRFLKNGGLFIFLCRLLLIRTPQKKIKGKN